MSVTARRDVLVVTTGCGVDESGGYQPGGMQLFSRLVVRALAGSHAVRRLGVLSVVDSQRAMDVTLRPLIEPAMAPGVKLGVHGAAGDRRAFVARYVRERVRYREAMFLHVNVARLAVLTPWLPSTSWLVGIEVRRALARHEKLALNLARPMLSISDFSTREMQRFNPDMPSAQTVHLSVEPDAEWIAGTTREPPRYGAADRARAVLIVARMAADERYKGHDQLIEAWPRVVSQVPDGELWIVGQGDDTPRLKRLADALPEQARSRVHFLGRLEHSALLDRYARARVFAMPSTGEGFGLVFVEAMRAGLPCIAGPDSAAEIVVDGETGLVVPQRTEAIATACVKLLADDAFADRCSEAGRARQQAVFTFEAFRDRLLDAMNLGRYDA